jgi:arylsulfatase A-like enzyme
MAFSKSLTVVASFSFLVFASLLLFNLNSVPSSGLSQLDATEQQADEGAGSPGGSGDGFSKPNIFLIMMDDLGWNDIGYQSSDLASFTPTMDRLASEGIKLNRHYTMSVCTPARAALLTGRHPVQLGMQHSQIMPAAPWGLPLSEKLLPEYLKTEGYEAHMVGKWHLGNYKSEYLPLERGFDSFYGYMGAGIEHSTHISLESCVDMRDEQSNTQKTCAKDMFDGTTFIGEDDDVKGTYSTELLEARMKEVIQSYDSDSPLFMYLPMQSVHGPLDLHESYYEANKDLFDDVPNDDRRTFAVLLKLLDNSISELMEVTKEQGLFENSYFIFLSDNGGDVTSGGNNYPLRGMKNTLFEGGVRTPAFIYSPLLPSEVRGTEYNKMFHVTDWLPTILEGILNHKADDFKRSSSWYGVNQWAALMGKDDTPREELLLNMDYLNNAGNLTSMKAALIQGHYKFIMNQAKTSWYDVPGAGETVKARRRGVSNFLFDLSEDPTENRNRYQSTEEYTAIGDAMEERIYELQRKMMKRCIWKKEDETSVWNVWLKEGGYPMVPYMDDHSEVEIESKMYLDDPKRWRFEKKMFEESE